MSIAKRAAVISLAEKGAERSQEARSREG